MITIFEMPSHFSNIWLVDVSAMDMDYDMVV